jgi:oxygen-dependent protoporphyrinogen oxidase
VLEATGQVGGKLRASEVGGVVVDEGADSMLRRVPWGVDLATANGLELVSPATSEASLWSRGTLVAMPLGTVMGIPTDLGSLAGLLRNPVRETPAPPPLDDLSVGALVSRSLGREVVDRLVDPLLGGVYAGHADRLSVRATLPQLWPHLAGRTSLVEAAQAARGTPTPGPVFAGLVGGLGTLPPALAQGLDVRLNATVRGLARTSTGWRLELLDAFLEVDAVILAVPAAPAARLLQAHVATEELAEVDYASVGIITLVLDGPAPGTGSGYLIPAVDGHVTKAVTFTSRKWGRPGPAVIRASVGRAGAVADLQRDDADLVTIVRRELEQAVGPLPPVLGTRVTRWGGGLPQYAVGHLDLVARLRRALPAGLALAGAAYDGVGVPAVARSGQVAAQYLAEQAQWRHG